ncbi:MAG: hypothetical protein EB120_07055 [Proteobacteria bacterium]|nr:hypothetical protein [Pseudomonadota bacterium]
MAGVSSRLQTTVASRLQTVQMAQSMSSLGFGNDKNGGSGGMSPTPIPIVKLQSPFQGDDVQRRIINVDSRFRSNPDNSTTSNFSFKLSKPIKNAVRIRVVSIEIPNNYHFFCASRKNITMAVEYGTNYGTRVVITIDPGNYIASEMETELNTKLSEANIKWLTVSWDNVQGFFCFTGTQAFRLDMTAETFDRRFDYGLGFYLGFSRAKKAGVYDGTKYHTTCSDFYANFAGDNYLLLSVGGLNCVQHQTSDGECEVLGKIILREPKNYMVFDDYASQHAKEVIFVAPTELDKLDIQILDPYTHPINFQNANVSVQNQT